MCFKYSLHSVIRRNADSIQTSWRRLRWNDESRNSTARCHWVILIRGAGDRTRRFSPFEVRIIIERWPRVMERIWSMRCAAASIELPARLGGRMSLSEMAVTRRRPNSSLSLTCVSISKAKVTRSRWNSGLIRHTFAEATTESRVFHIGEIDRFYRFLFIIFIWWFNGLRAFENMTQMYFFAAVNLKSTYH